MISCPHFEIRVGMFVTREMRFSKGIGGVVLLWRLCRSSLRLFNAHDHQDKNRTNRRFML